MIFGLTTFFITKLNVPERAAKLAAYVTLIVIAVMLLLGIVLTAHSCYVSYKIEQTQNDINEIRNEQINTNVNKTVATIEAKDADNRVIEARREAEKAKETLKEVQGADSSKESQDAREALKRFCEVYGYKDSLCEGMR